MLRILSILLLIFGFASNIFSQGNLSADEVLTKASAALTDTKGLGADFTIKSGQNVGYGSLKTSGERFYVALPDVEVWYNGKLMYTYNKRIGETSLTVPTLEEISEINPLYYVRNWKDNFSARFSDEKKQGRYVIDLVPKAKGSDLKKVTVTLKASDFMPESFVGYPENGSPLLINISSFQKGKTFGVHEFDYPVVKYQDVEVIDLR